MKKPNSSFKAGRLVCRLCKTGLKDRTQEHTEFIRSLKKSPCVDCGKSYPFYVMHFDHLRDKKRGLSDMKTASKETILKEVSKCELVCANCHAERTYQRSTKCP